MQNQKEKQRNQEGKKKERKEKWKTEHGWRNWEEEPATKEMKYGRDEVKEQSSITWEDTSNCQRNLEKGHGCQQSQEGKTLEEGFLIEEIPKKGVAR